MALSAADSNVRDQVALRLADRTYANLTTQQTTILGGTSGSIPRALTTLQRWSNFFDGTGTADAPDDWMPWFVDLATYEGSLAMRPDLSGEFRRKALESQRDAFLSWSRGSMAGTTETDEKAFTLAALRRYIASRCVKRADPVYPDISTIDSSLDWTIVRIWNDADWRFTQILATLTINTDQTVTAVDADGNSITIDRILGDVIYLTNGKGEVSSVDRDVILRHQTLTNPETGSPVFFHLQKTASTVRFWFAPVPDVAYTAKCMVQIRTPSITDATAFNAAMAQFPHEFVNVVRDMAYGKVLNDLSVRDGPMVLRQAAEDLAGLVDQYDNPGGQPEASLEGRWQRRGLGVLGPFLGGGM